MEFNHCLEGGEKMGIPAVEALRGSLPALFGSPLRQIVPERREQSPVAISNETVDVYIKPQTEAVASMTIATFGARSLQLGLVLSERTKVQVVPTAEEPKRITIKDPYGGRVVTIFKGGRVTSRSIDVKV